MQTNDDVILRKNFYSSLTLLAMATSSLDQIFNMSDFIVHSRRMLQREANIITMLICSTSSAFDTKQFNSSNLDAFAHENVLEHIVAYRELYGHNLTKLIKLKVSEARFFI
jgi:hypothetical protein